MKLNGISFDKIEKEYMVSDDPMYDRPEMISIISQLSIDERRTIIMYAELDSKTELARIFNCSRFTIYKRINQIRAKIRYIMAYRAMVRAVFDKSLDDIDLIEEPEEEDKET